MENLIKFFTEGDIWMYPILIAFLMALAVMVERCFMLYMVYSIHAPTFWAKLQQFVLAGHFDKGINLCNGQERALLPRVLKSALTQAERPIEEVKTAVEEGTLEIMPLLERRAMWLPLLANIGTLLGLLGTVMGLIQAFAAVATAAPDQKQAMLSASIAIAMNTTAFGLIVAIPSLVANTIIQGKISQILSDVDQYSTKIVNLLAASKANQAAKK